MAEYYLTKEGLKFLESLPDDIVERIERLEKEAKNNRKAIKYLIEKIDEINASQKAE